MVDLLHRRRIEIEDQLEGFELIERIGWSVARERRRRDRILVEYIPELKEPNGPREHEQRIRIRAVRRHHEDVEIQEDRRILIHNFQRRVVADLVGNVLERLLFADVDHREDEHIARHRIRSTANAFRDVPQPHLRRDYSCPVRVGQVFVQLIDDDRQGVREHRAALEIGATRYRGCRFIVKRIRCDRSRKHDTNT